MLLFDGSHDKYPISAKEIEEYFYQLEFSGTQKKEDVIYSIAQKIPWTYSIKEIIDQIEDPTLRAFSRNFMEAINIRRVYHYIAKIKEKDNRSNYIDLEQGVFLISSIGDPHISYSKVSDKLNSLAEKVMELFELNKLILSDDVKIHLLSRVLHQEEGFNGNKEDYQNPNNSYLSYVLKSKLGIPLSLSVLYLLVGLRLKLPLYGANFPLHFMLFYETPKFKSFIDPFHGGVLVERNTCAKFLEANGFSDVPEKFIKPSTTTILKRMVTNLINIYKNQENHDKENIFLKLLEILR
ncbi:MAG: transglutaminase-like domain-containing protein [Spirochaetota bacterium]